jgi:hypothetical protein
VAGQDSLALDALIKDAADLKLISERAAKQASLAKDARNLVHPGRVARTGFACNRGTALASLAALDQVIEDLGRLA